MPKLRSHRLTEEVLVRVIADILIVNASAVTGLTFRFLYLVAFQPAPVEGTYNDLFWAYVRNYANSALLLTSICLLVFALSGFYTKGRAYKGRYKVLVVSQAVSLAYLLL